MSNGLVKQQRLQLRHQLTEIHRLLMRGL